MTRCRRSSAGWLVVGLVGCNGLLGNSDAYLASDATNEGAVDAGTVGNGASSTTTSGGGNGGSAGASGSILDSGGAGAIGAPADAALADRISETSTDPTDASPLDGKPEARVTPDSSDAAGERSLEASVTDVSVIRDASSPPVCRQSSGAPQIDPNTGISWNPIWYCANDRGAALFERANSGTQIGYMTTIDSWFVCFRHGEVHRGGDDVWYYTQGDGTLPGWEARHAWGYMPSFYVRTNGNPFAGIPECTANP